ncbi:unnamed protein product, partial [Vitis vinifera]
MHLITRGCTTKNIKRIQGRTKNLRVLISALWALQREIRKITIAREMRRSSRRAQVSKEMVSMRSWCTVSPESIGKMHLQMMSSKIQREGGPNWSAGQATRRGITTSISSHLRP